jgi:hypothetical protein
MPLPAAPRGGRRAGSWGWCGAGRRVAVVDLARGRVLAQWRGRVPELLVDGCCEGPVG